MNRKKGYADLQKHRNTCNKQIKRYYSQRNFGDGKPHRWTEHEIDMIMKHEITDTEIARILHRSVKAIQVKRVKVKKEAVINGCF